MSTTPPARRSVGAIIVAVLFALLALNAWNEALSIARGGSGSPSALGVWQALVGACGAATAWGAWKRARWSPIAAALFGVITAAMLVSLGPLLDMPVEERSGLLMGAGMVLVFSLGCAWYLRRLTRDVRAETSREIS